MSWSNLRRKDLEGCLIAVIVEINAPTALIRKMSCQYPLHRWLALLQSQSRVCVTVALDFALEPVWICFRAGLDVL